MIRTIVLSATLSLVAATAFAGGATTPNDTNASVSAAQAYQRLLELRRARATATTEVQATAEAQATATTEVGSTETTRVGTMATPRSSDIVAAVLAGY